MQYQPKKNRFKNTAGEVELDKHGWAASSYRMGYLDNVTSGRAVAWRCSSGDGPVTGYFAGGDTAPQLQGRHNTPVGDDVAVERQRRIGEVITAIRNRATAA